MFFVHYYSDIIQLYVRSLKLRNFQGISTAPLWDFSKGQFLGNHGSNLTEEELETHAISTWKEAKLYLLKQITEHGKIFSKRLVQAGPDENLEDITLKILQNRVATLPITHLTSDDGSYPQLLYLASLSEALQLGQEPYSTYGTAGQRCHMCLRSDSLHKVMERLAKPGVRRVVIVEAGSKRVEEQRHVNLNCISLVRSSPFLTTILLDLPLCSSASFATLWNAVLPGN
ncbi:hypothetical protein Tco_0261787 [Tanacetum coccineum]